jgi:uncharacterized protein YdeI (YjbR/CyaY-like superfamily)
VTTVTQKQVPTESFTSAGEWRRWLCENHALSDGVRLRIFKNDSGVRTVTYAEALDEALCFGWIDGQKQKCDEKSWLQKFTPRRPKSLWSKRNRERVAQLIEEGRMTPAGLKQVEAAKEDGRWNDAYDAQSAMTVPHDFLDRLSENEQALAFFGTLNRANIYAIAWRLQTAKKPETREKRMRTILEMLAQGKPLH